MSGTAPVFRTYPAGVSCWIDLEAPDAADVAPFCSALLGWTLTTRGRPNRRGTT